MGLSLVEHNLLLQLEALHVNLVGPRLETLGLRVELKLLLETLVVGVDLIDLSLKRGVFARTHARTHAMWGQGVALCLAIFV